jgi:NitT/TauT family transport system substrate-binding protein
MQGWVRGRRRTPYPTVLGESPVLPSPTRGEGITTWFVVIAVLLAVGVAFEPGAARAQTKVRLAVGGKPAMFYLPLTVVERLGYFKDAGLDVEISDFPGGARALQSLVGGSADVVAGAFDHTIQMQAKGQPIVGVTEIGQYPGFVLGVLTAKAVNYRSAADLKGLKIGITAPGSSTHFMVRYLMAQAGLKDDDAAFIGIGAGPTAVAAARRGEIDALVNVDPVISLLENDKTIRVVADTRTLEGTRHVFGGAYPAAVLYVTPAYIQNNGATVQALANAFVRGLRWIATRSAQEIADLMPAEYALGDKDNYVRSIKNSMPMFSPDGRIGGEGPEVALKVLRQFDPDVQRAFIDLAATYTDAFVEKALAR